MKLQSLFFFLLFDKIQKEEFCLNLVFLFLYFKQNWYENMFPWLSVFSRIFFPNKNVFS